MKGLPRSLGFAKTSDGESLLDAVDEALATFPGAPIYDVMAEPFNAIGDGVTDDTAAINAAIAAANITSGYIYLGHKHKVTSALTPFHRDAIGIIGRGCRGDGTLIQIPTGLAPFNVFTVDTVKDCVFRDFFLEGPGDWGSRGLGIFIDDAFRTRVERVEIQKTYGAIEIYASVITEIIDTYAAAIYGPYAFYAYGSLADGENHALRFRGCATGTDVSGGTITWYKQGSGSHTFELINCGALHGGKGLHVCNDTPYGGDSSPRFTRAINFQCEDAEINAIHLEAGATASFTQLLVLSCLGNAFQVDSTYSGNWEVNGGMIHGADGHGMSLSSDHWSVTGLQVGNIDPGKDCIHVNSGVTDFSITGCSLGDIFGSNAGSAYGINLDATCDRFSIVGNRILGNDTSTINNPAGVSVNRIVEGNTPSSANIIQVSEIETMAVGSYIGRAMDAGSTGRPTVLTNIDMGESIRIDTRTDDSSTSGTGSPYTVATQVNWIRFTGLTGTYTLNGCNLTEFGKIIIWTIEPGLAGNVVFTHNAGVTNAQRFFCPGGVNLTVNAGDVVVTCYTSSRHRVISVSTRITSDHLAPVIANVGVPFTHRVSFAATGVTGTMVDVTMWNANAPFALRIIRAEVLVATAAGTASALRTASAGGGSVILPDAASATQTFSTATTGHKVDNSTVSATVAANGSVFFNVDRAVAGEVILTCVRT